MVLRVINVVAFSLMIVMNYLANALPLNNKTTGELSAQYPNLFVPAGITFSVWGIIYLLLLVYLVLQFRAENKDVVNAIGWAFAVSCLLNAAWIVAWHFEQLPLSLLIMIGLLMSLIYICWKIQMLPLGWIKAAFGVYLGWICIATIANVTALMVYYNWNGFGISDVVWAGVMIAAGLIISSIVLVRFQNPFIGVVVMWAFVGIVIARENSYPVVGTIAMIAIGFMLVLTVWVFMYPSFYRTGVN